MIFSALKIYNFQLKMSRHKYIFNFIILTSIFLTDGESLFSDLFFEKDQCTDVCVDSFFLLPSVNNAQQICQRGCRFFNIISLKNDQDASLTKEECHLSCDEAYMIKDEKETCNIGCNTIANKRQHELTNSVVLYIEQDGQKNMMIIQPEFEQIETGIIADPSLRSQVNMGYNVEYKIPEAHIRTMPIGEVLENDIPVEGNSVPKINSGDWLDCAARNSGIPRWLLLSTILTAILVALWLSLSTDRRAPLEEVPDPILTKNEVEFSNPPKYELIAEKV